MPWVTLLQHAGSLARRCSGLLADYPEPESPLVGCAPSSSLLLAPPAPCSSRLDIVSLSTSTSHVNTAFPLLTTHPSILAFSSTPISAPHSSPSHSPLHNIRRPRLPSPTPRRSPDVIVSLRHRHPIPAYRSAVSTSPTTHTSHLPTQQRSALKCELRTPELGTRLLS